MSQQDLLKQAEEIQQAAVDYIARVQPMLDAQEKSRAEFAKKAHQTVGALVERRIVAPGDANELVDKLASDPSQALDLVLSVARKAGVSAELGKKAGTAAPDESSLDPFERLYFYGDARA